MWRVATDPEEVGREIPEGWHRGAGFQKQKAGEKWLAGRVIAANHAILQTGQVQTGQQRRIFQ